MAINDGYFKHASTLRKIARKIEAWCLQSAPPPDNVDTPHNKSFIDDASFREGYNLACEKIGRDYRIPWRAHQAVWAARHGLKLEGDFVELGTGKGFVMQCVLGSIDNWPETGKTLWLYDTFRKYEETGKGQAKHDKYYASSVEEVRSFFRPFDNVKLVEGDVQVTIQSSRPKKISFLHVDLNDAILEVHLLEQLFPLMVSGGIILLDDYANKGEEVAYELHNHFFSALQRPILTTPSGQGIVIT